jgi:transposase
MSAKRQIYPAEFKREAGSLITHHGYGVREAARHLGLHATMLRPWKRALEQQGAPAFPGTGRLRPEPEALQRRRQENKRLRMERDLLQKATRFSAHAANCGSRLLLRRTRVGRCRYGGR